MSESFNNLSDVMYKFLNMNPLKKYDITANVRRFNDEVYDLSIYIAHITKEVIDIIGRTLEEIGIYDWAINDGSLYARFK